mgnify:FL=1
MIFDLETKKFFDDTGTFDPADLGVSVVSLYFRELDNDLREVSGEMISFWEKDFEVMWQLFRKANRIIGFNSLHFDVPALKPYAPSDFAKLPHFDMMAAIKEEFGKRVSLNSLARDTLNSQKNDHGTNAILYWNAGDPQSLAKLKKYCEMDVELTKKLYDFGKDNKFLRFTDHWNTPRKIPIDFSYPKELLALAKQDSLF